MQKDRHKLLIVDDQEQQLKKYMALFEGDFDCLTAISGEIAIEIFQREVPHIILCDVKMPGGMSGFDLCKQIKSISPQTIIILTSSYNNKASRMKGYESRADEYLNKITSDEEIYLKVRNLVYTQHNIPAYFPRDEISSLKSINSFEEDVKSIIYGYYGTPVHLRSAIKIDLETISDTLHKSNRTIQRGFLRDVGCTFSDFHNKTRLDIAARLLINTDKSVKEVAEELAFSSPSVFSKSFRLFHGMTPSKYRQNYLDDKQ